MTQNTVFVIGAGASTEVGLPTGGGLKEEISKLLDIRFNDFGTKQKSGDNKILNAIRMHVRQTDDQTNDINQYLKAAWQIRDALPQAISIDNFIDAHPDDKKIALCGKLAIIRAILAAEQESELYFEEDRINPNINFEVLEKTWYGYFFKVLTENCSKNDLKERFDSIKLIIFNYDRCVEHFICHALRNYYNIQIEEAAELVRNIRIYHPYGDVGVLPWVNRNGAVGYGSELPSERLLDLAMRIKTFTEGTDPNSSEVLDIRKHMGEANRLVFLGFAFLKLNMQLIAPGHGDEGDGPSIKVFATTKGISHSDKEVIKEHIIDSYNKNVGFRMIDKPCAEFFTEYWRSLAF